MNPKYFISFLLFSCIGITLFAFIVFTINIQHTISGLAKDNTKLVTVVSSSSDEILYPADYILADDNSSVSSSLSSVSSNSSLSSTTTTLDNIIKYNIPTVMYHHINPVTVNDKNDKLLAGLSVSPDKFESDLKDIQKLGFETIYPYEVEEKLKANFKQDKKYVMITIDDGYEDVYKYALPILKKYNMKATYYVMPNFVGRKDVKRTNLEADYATWDEIIEMKNSGVINIGSHTMDHIDLSNSKYKETELRYQIFDSKRILEERLGIEIKDFCYPYGKYNAGTVKLVKEAGYLTATIIKASKVITLTNIFEIPRYHGTNTNPLRNLLK